MSSRPEITNIYLIGPCAAEFTGRKLPTTRDVLRVFHHNHTVLKYTIPKSAKLTIDELHKVWCRAGIPVREGKNSIAQLKKLHQRWRNIQSSRSRKRSLTHQKNENKFKEDINMLFDITRQDAMLVVTEYQRQFLLAQRAQNRRGFIPTHSTLPDIDMNRPECCEIPSNTEGL